MLLSHRPEPVRSVTHYYVLIKVTIFDTALKQLHSQLLYINNLKPVLSLISFFNSLVMAVAGMYIRNFLKKLQFEIEIKNGKVKCHTLWTTDKI